MELHGRLLRSEDAAACAKLLRERYSFEKFDAELVLKTFAEWATQATLKGYVMESGGRLVCFGASVFVSDDEAQRLLSDARPFLGAQLVRSSTLPNSPVLHPKNISKENSNDGVNIVIIHSGLPPREFDEETAQRTKALMMQGFISLHAGFVVKQIFIEAFGETERAFYAATDFAEVASFDREQQTPSFLLRLTRERVLALSIHPLLPLFTNVKPKFFFTHNEQILLAQALEGHTDEELAQLLRVSLSVLKKRWNAIFLRAGEQMPELSQKGSANGKTRGAQKRHLLLRHLRNRPEELRPYPPSREATRPK